MMIGEQGNLIIFDGVCNLCNGSVNFVIRHDKRKIFKFTAFQSIYGRDIVERFKIEQETQRTIILITDGKVYRRSMAVLEIFEILGGAWKLMRVLKIFPLCFRDWCYDVISRHRYRLFGRKQSCMVPTDSIRERFLM
jgi:predicted DCC family thiol-disulfide oxidoreductase YuxK